MEIKQWAEENRLRDPIYLGDSVYAAHDGYGVWLVTWNGYSDDPRNVIGMEPKVLKALSEYLQYIFEVPKEPPPCPCCGKGYCECQIQQVEGSDASVGYHEVVSWCVRPHDRKVGE